LACIPASLCWPLLFAEVQMSALSAFSVLLLLLNVTGPTHRRSRKPSPGRRDLVSSSVRGVVVDGHTSQPISDASVILHGTKLNTVTDDAGRFVFDDVPAGRWVLEIQHIAYQTRSDTIEVKAGNDMFVEASMSEAAIPLQPLVVTVRPQKLVAVGFYERKSRGIGTYITRDDIIKRHVERLSDLLSSVAGLRRTINNDGTSQINMRGVKTIATRCDTQYFLDGVPADIGVLGPDIVPIRDIEGIEIYKGSSELPMQFDVGRAMCGAILIWTRDGR
jgi:CarboxypepD_reg-like domain/TonB-dependent Receptor Plug Domain